MRRVLLQVIFLIVVALELEYEAIGVWCLIQENTTSVYTDARRVPLRRICRGDDLIGVSNKHTFTGSELLFLPPDKLLMYGL